MRTKLHADKHPEDWELKRLLAGINLRSTWGKRTYLLILFICHTGLRVGELTRLTVADVVWGEEPREEVFLSHRITKGRKSRVVPFNEVAKETSLGNSQRPDGKTTALHASGKTTPNG